LKRIVRVLIVAMLVAMILVVASAPAFARRTLGTEVTTRACETAAGVAGFQWRSDKEVCWLQFPVQLPAASR
jgi:peptidoglycan/LPS O-acetylase OafA/YrhL